MSTEEDIVDDNRIDLKVVLSLLFFGFAAGALTSIVVSLCISGLVADRSVLAQNYVRDVFSGKEKAGFNTEDVLSYKIVSCKKRTRYEITVDAKIQCLGTPTEELKFGLVFNDELNEWEIKDFASRRKAIEE